jgi:hypothetical protein
MISHQAGNTVEVTKSIGFVSQTCNPYRLDVGCATFPPTRCVPIFHAAVQHRGPRISTVYETKPNLNEGASQGTDIWIIPYRNNVANLSSPSAFVLIAIGRTVLMTSAPDAEAGLAQNEKSKAAYCTISVIRAESTVQNERSF